MSPLAIGACGILAMLAAYRTRLWALGVVAGAGVLAELLFDNGVAP